MIRRILLAELPNDDLKILKTPSMEVSVDDDVDSISKDLIDTLAASGGIGLAAPQIGINKRIFVINRKEISNLVCINPVIVSAVGRMKFDEGCLSFPNKLIRKTRKQFVKLKFYNKNFVEQEMQFSGVDAICVQHELNHLDGILLINE